jgi:hypothetical protein
VVWVDFLAQEAQVLQAKETMAGALLVVTQAQGAVAVQGLLALHTRALIAALVVQDFAQP